MAEEKKSRVESVMSSGSKSKKKKPKKKAKKSGHKVHKMHISRTANDKYTAEHEFEPGTDGVTPPPETHGLENIDELKDHVGEHMAPEEPQSEQAQGPQTAGAPTPSMGM
jgi:hypothetical protein